MRRLPVRVFSVPAVFVSLAAVGCGGDTAPVTDATVRDSGSADAGGARDAGVDGGASVDGGENDGGQDVGAPDVGGSDASAADAGGDASAACASAREGDACVDEGLVCGGPCADECSFCNLLECRDGQWIRHEVLPAPCFSCGPTLQCVTGERYCSVFLPGVPGGEPSYECVLPPTDCEATLNCECLMRRGVFGDCQEEGAGEITVTVAAP